jgi:hypothetical protein
MSGAFGDGKAGSIKTEEEKTEESGRIRPGGFVRADSLAPLCRAYPAGRPDVGRAGLTDAAQQSPRKKP